jgi:hypothetical protein
MGKFFKQFKDILVTDLLAVHNSIATEPSQSLAPLNDSYIALVAKKDNARQTA